MTNVFATLRPELADAPALQGKWRWIVALGIVYLLLGVVALSTVVLATVASVFVVGIMMVISGVAEIISAFQIRTWGKFLLWALLGVFYVVAGILVFDNPLLAAAALTLALGVILVVSGGMRLALALSMPSGSAWGVVLCSAILTTLLGLVILARWPVSSLYALGVFLGVDLIVAGAGWLSVGLTLQRASGRGDDLGAGATRPA
jgi:uncharacterized membrane protein HdeD (DUF308 family)